ncbi:MAG: ASKHA domain-containing protein [Nitrososphaerota archaeon]
MIEIVFQPYGKKINIEKNINLLEAARIAGIGIRSVCGGKGTCGKCKIIVKKGNVDFKSIGEEFLTEDEALKGYVLACLSYPLEDCEIFVPIESRIEGQKLQLEAKIPKISLLTSIKKIYYPPEKIDYALQLTNLNKEAISLYPKGITLTIREYGKKKGVINIENGDTSKNFLGLAIDIGTTKIVAYLVDMENGNIINKVSDFNKQLVYGEDVVSRIGYTYKKDERKYEMQKAVIDTINDLIFKLLKNTNFSINDIYDVCVAGNTVMTYLFAGIDAFPLLEPGSKISKEPIILDSSFLGLKVNSLSEVYCLPCSSRFIGGDVIGDILTSGMFKSEEPALLIDIGTNVEVVLGCKDWFISTTAAAGPAFEGWGVSFGIRAIEGAIDSIKINPKNFKAEYTTIGNTKPKGICGSGFIDLLAEMFRNDIMDSGGKINSSIETPYIRYGEKGYEYIVVPSEETAIGKDIVISEKDIANLLDGKAAACAAIGIILKKMRLTVNDINKVYVCGAFGNYINLNNAMAIGLIPEFPNAQIEYLGNGSIGGAYLTLMSIEYRKEAERIAKLLSYIDLMKDIDFIEEYTAAFSFPGKESLFPSKWWKKKKISCT